MTDTPRTDAALTHQGATHMDAIIRLERLIEVSRQLERELAEAKASLQSAEDHHYYSRGVDGR